MTVTPKPWIVVEGVTRRRFRGNKTQQKRFRAHEEVLKFVSSLLCRR